MIYSSRIPWNRGSCIVFYALACLFLNSLWNSHLHWIIAEKSSSLIISMLNFFIQNCYLLRFLLKGKVSFENIVKVESSPCLSKAKIKLEEFYVEGRERQKYLSEKQLLVSRAMYFLAALTFISACKCNWTEVAPSSASPAHSCHMAKTATTWQCTQTRHKTVCQLKPNIYVHQEIEVKLSFTGAPPCVLHCPVFSIKVSFKDMLVPPTVLN